jgi:hypothetical protein
LAIKADRNSTLQSPLYADYASSLGNPASGVTRENIFKNPPLDQMGDLSYFYAEYSKADAISCQAPVTWETQVSFSVFTIAFNYFRATQFALQNFNNSSSTALFVRTRHIDNTDFTVWQPWRRVACQRDKVEKKALILPPNFGFFSEASCARDQFGMVTLVAGVKKMAGPFVDGDLVATIPEGFRPLEYLDYVAAISGANNTGKCLLCVFESGEIKARQPNAADSELYMDFSYYAG